MSTFRIPVVVLALLLPMRLPAQGQDPMREIQELAKRVDEQLQEIDRLLLESGKKGLSRDKPKEMLQQAHERSTAVDEGLEKLIEKLNQMKSKGGGGGSPDQQQQQQDQQDQQDQQQGGKPKPQQGQRNRRENQTEDFVKRQRPQPGEQQGQQQGQQPGQKPEGQQPGQKPGEGQQQPNPEGNPQGGQENPDGGQNTRGNRQPEPNTGPGQPGTGDGSWGELQPYMNFLKNRGSRPPQVPEKFRKYWEAYLKQKQGQGGGGK